MHLVTDQEVQTQRAATSPPHKVAVKLWALQVGGSVRQDATATATSNKSFNINHTDIPSSLRCAAVGTHTVFS